jgi:hypothetical protein
MEYISKAYNTVITPLGTAIWKWAVNQILRGQNLVIEGQNSMRQEFKDGFKAIIDEGLKALEANIKGKKIPSSAPKLEAMLKLPGSVRAGTGSVRAGTGSFRAGTCLSVEHYKFPPCFTRSSHRGSCC